MKESRKFSSFCSVNSLENFEISEIDFELQKDESVLNIGYHEGKIYIFTSLSMHEVKILLKNLPKNKKAWKKPLLYELEANKL